MEQPTEENGSNREDGALKAHGETKGSDILNHFNTNFEQSLGDSHTVFIKGLGGYPLTSTSGSVITSSSFPGVQGTINFSTSIERNFYNYNAHFEDEIPQKSSNRASQCSSSSMEARCTQYQEGTHMCSNSQSAQSPKLDCGESGTQGSSLTATTKNPSGAKFSELYCSSQIDSSSTLQPVPWQNMQQALNHLKDLSCPMLESLLPEIGTESDTPSLVKKSNIDSHSTGTLLDVTKMKNYPSKARSDVVLENFDENDIIKEKTKLCNAHNTIFSKWQGTTDDMSSSFIGSHIPNLDIMNNQNNKIVGSRNDSAFSTTQNSYTSQNTSEKFKGYEGLIGAVGGCDPSFENNNYEEAKNLQKTKQKRVPPIRLGLLGGGENSLSNGTSTWGLTPPGNAAASNWNVNSNGNAGNQWNSAGRQGGPSMPPDSNCSGQGMSPPKQHSTWAQAAGKGLTGPSQTNGNPTNGNRSIGSVDQGSHGANDQLVKPCIEEYLSEHQISAVLSEGWGQSTINQDTLWDVPLSPHSNSKEGNSFVWKAPANNGTEIWENNIRHRNKGSNVNAPSRNNSQPWGHTPSTNIGGTWGEEEDNTNMWTGVPQPEGNNWSGIDNGSNMWGSSSHNNRQGQWTGPGHGGSWDESGGGEGSSGPGNGQDGGGPAWNPVNKTPNIGTWSPVTTPKKDLQASGWEESSSTQRRSTSGFDDGTSVWGNPQRQVKASNWKEMPLAKPVNGMGGPGMVGNNMISCGPNIPPVGPGMIHLPPPINPSSKPDMGTSMWGKMPPTNHGQNWPDMPRRDTQGSGTWDESHMQPILKNMPGTTGWGESMGPPFWGAKPKSTTLPSWFEGHVDTSNWIPMKGGKPLTRDLICASKQFRLLSEMGFKKEDVENTLRSNNMNFEEALAELQAIANRENAMMDVFGSNQKMRHNMADDANFIDHSGDISCGPGTVHSYGGGYSGAQGFKHQVKGSAINSNSPSLLNNAAIGGQQSSLGAGNSITGMSQALMQKLLQQQSSPFGLANMHQNALGGQGGRMNQPSASHLKVLVQQIQMAVQAGHLNPQILNQPLAPQTLQLLYQLLQQIKVLHQIQQQLHVPQQFGKGGPTPTQLNVYVTQTKQRIHNLRNQIAAQQAHFIKQQETPTPQTHSRLSQWKLPTLDKEERNSPMGNTESNNLGDFSRAPGTMSKPAASMHTSHSSSNMQSLISNHDNTWSSLPHTLNNAETWPESSSPADTTRSTRIGPSNSNLNISSSASVTSLEPTSNITSSVSDNEAKEATASTCSVSSSSSQPSYNLNDLVTEFEPGKPWKGNSRMKNIEDDPHITPGSVTRSPLSLNTIKDTDLLGWTSKSRPLTTSSGDSLVASLASLTSNPWTFNSASCNGSALNKYNGSKSSWGLSSGEVWGAPGSKIQRPPPGLPGQGKGTSSCWGSNPAWDKQNSFLVLRNLTPQIDGSTLKTLCMQHGPLLLFHLLLNQGITLVKYSTREEAVKAQSALNNCVLGNTTIFSEIPSEAEVQSYLCHTGGGQLAGASGMGWSGNQSPNNNTIGPNFRGNAPFLYGGNRGVSSSEKGDSSTWNGANHPNGPSQLWSFSGSGGGGGSVWSTPQSVNERDQNVAMNCFLPVDLLGSEVM
ncbi:protein Gawky-like isoform X2 [Limulus polyphemus]|uniref:Protein Gawky-like isoform X2 n=1 Tax=Limulus polyphemus TaxID=6850 RepID=A0ABM1TNI3_LIMPO|nr:protein Gawky-like isoform X2 [Limulus polyphemus]